MLDNIGTVGSKVKINKLTFQATVINGFSIPTAVLTVAIVFVAATSLLALSINQISSTSRNIAAIRAYYNAKKGITAAVNVLNRDGQLPLQPDGTRELRTTDFTASFSNNTNTLTSTGRTRTTGFRIPRTLTKTITVKLISNLETYKFEESFSSARFKDGSSTASWTDDGNLELKYENISEPPNWFTVNEVIDSSIHYNSAVAIDVDSNNRPHVAYADEDGKLRYGRWTGSYWEFPSNPPQNQYETVDTGYNISLKLDKNNRPVIAWFQSNGWWSGAGISAKIARWTGNKWDITSPPQERQPTDISLAIDSNNNPHISYIEKWWYSLYGGQMLNFQLKYARWTGSSWQAEKVGSGWQVYVSRSEPWWWPTWAESSIALDSGNNPHITHANFETGYDNNTTVNYRYKKSGQWSQRYVVTNGTYLRNKGLASYAGEFYGLRLRIDKNDVPQAAYFEKAAAVSGRVEPPRAHLLYSKSTTSLGNWQPPEIIERYDYAPWVNGPGFDIDSSNNPHIAYVNNGGSTIGYLRKQGGNWIYSNLGGSVYRTLDFALDDYQKYHLIYADLYDYDSNIGRAVYIGNRMLSGKTRTGYAISSQSAISKILTNNQGIRKAKVVVTPTTSSNGQITFTLNNGASQLSTQNNVQLLTQPLTFDFDFPTLGNNLSYQINLSNGGNSNITPQINHLTIYYIIGNPYTINYKTWRAN